MGFSIGNFLTNTPGGSTNSFRNGVILTTLAVLGLGGAILGNGAAITKGATKALTASCLVGVETVANAFANGSGSLIQCINGVTTNGSNYNLSGAYLGGDLANTNFIESGGYLRIGALSGGISRKIFSMEALQGFSGSVVHGEQSVTSSGTIKSVGLMTSVGGVSGSTLTTGGATTITKIMSNTATLDFGNLASIGCEDLTVTVNGAALNDVVDIGVPNGSVVSGGNFTGWVSSANTVSIRFCVAVTGNPASGTFRTTVLHFTP